MTILVFSFVSYWSYTKCIIKWDSAYSPLEERLVFQSLVLPYKNKYGVFFGRSRTDL